MGNTFLGTNSGAATTTGSSNIVLGRDAATSAANASNEFIVGSATYWVATNGAAATYFPTAGASLGYMQFRLNGQFVKVQVYAP